MKILVSTFTYAPNIDGVAEAAQKMVESFRDAGHEVFVATTCGEQPSIHGAVVDTAVHRFRISGAPAIAAGFHGEIQAYLDFIVTLSPDIIVFHGWDTWPVELAIPLLPALKSKSVLLSHGQSSHTLNLRILPRGLVRWLRWLPHFGTLPLRIRKFDRVVFLSSKSDWSRFLDVRIARLTGARNIATIPNGVPDLQDTTHHAFRQRHGIGRGLVFLCIANYSERKNQERALRAFAAAALPDSTLIFIGSDLGDYGRRMIGLWRDLQATGAGGSVLFFEGLKRDETLAALHDCDVKILAADSETQPIVLLEAMAASKPFISTNTGCVEEFKGGVVVRDAGEMAAAMRRLAASPELRKQLGTEGRRDYQAHYSLERTSKAWLKLLAEVTAR